ncbi:MAG: type II secretion system F family protein, partial [Thermoplasmata archaeon]|nr:type II secretion system F family protein [Thermoplasmata archaeon]
PLTLLLYVGIAAVISGGAVGGYILYLKQTTRFTFRRYFATHTVEKQIYTIYVPLLAAFLVVLIGLAIVYSNPQWPANAVDYVFIVGIFVALTAFGVDARREMLRIRAFERAFAQFLFELADAMRGGLDPAKSIVELAKTHTNILAKPLKIASDGIQLGRPLDRVLLDMADPMHSPLIRRYAGLIADATSAGGETALVVYRAAKDMDDFVKIEEEREKQLLLPVAVIYIAFGVLMAVLFALLYIAPSLGTLNISFIGLGALPSSAKTAVQVPRLAYTELKERFFELMLINALGTGAIIGAFTEGRARYGILHSLALVAATAIAFAIVFP